MFDGKMVREHIFWIVHPPMFDGETYIFWWWTQWLFWGSQSPQAEASDFSPARQKFAWSKLSANLSGFAKQARGCLLNLNGEDVCVYIYYVGVSEKGVYP